MGYCCPGWYRLNTTRNCVKYASQPEKLIYRNYREIRRLFEEDGTDQPLFDTITKRIYPVLQNIDFKHTEAILFTRPMSDWVSDGAAYRHRIEQFISENYQSIIIKRHPREDEEYCFSDNVICTEIDNSVPAEALLPYLKGKECVVVMTSAITLYMKVFGIRCKILTFDGLYKESVASGTHYLPMTDKEVQEYCDKFTAGCYEITCI